GEAVGTGVVGAVVIVHLDPVGTRTGEPPLPGDGDVLDTDVAPLLLADLLPLTPVAQAVAGVETGGEGRARDRRACRDVGIDALPLVFLGCSCPRGCPGPPPPGTVERLPLLVVVGLVLGVCVHEVGA